jgi:hypothetical protein
MARSSGSASRLDGALADSRPGFDGAMRVCDSVFQAAQSGHCPAHFTLCAPHSVQTYAVFALAIVNYLFYMIFMELRATISAQ